MAFLMSGIKMNIQSNTGNVANISGISNAEEAVVECAAHTLNVNDTVVIESVTGQPKINNAVARVKSKTSANVTLESLDSTDFGTYVSGGTIKKVTQWIPITNATDFNFAEPQANRQTIMTIHDEQSTDLLGADSSPQASFNIYADAFDAGVIEMRKASKTKTNRVFELIFKNGNKLYLNSLVAGGRGVSGQANSPATGAVELALQSSEQWYQS